MHIIIEGNDIVYHIPCHISTHIFPLKRIFDRYHLVMSDEFNTNGRQFHDGMVACSSYCILHHITSYHLSYDSTLAHTSLLQHIRDLILFCRRLCGFDD